jgi:predicted Zn-dependent protease
MLVSPDAIMPDGYYRYIHATSARGVNILFRICSTRAIMGVAPVSKGSHYEPCFFTGLMMDAASRTAGTLSGQAPAEPLDFRAALEQSAAGLEAEPQAALDVAEQILAQQPGLPPAQFLAAQALRRLGNPAAALARLAALPGGPRRPAMVLWETAQAASEAGATDQAIAALEALTRQDPGVATGWFLLAKELRKAGREQDAWRADLSAVHATSRDPDLLAAKVNQDHNDLISQSLCFQAVLVHVPRQLEYLRL